MDKKKSTSSQKELYQLMVSSISIQTLPNDERKKLQTVLLELPEGAMHELIKILKKEHKEMERLQKAQAKEMAQIEKLEEAVAEARDAARTLNRSFLAIRESSNEEAEARVTEELLEDLDNLS